MHLFFPQVIVWDCLNNYEYDNAIFLAERLHAEGNYYLIIFLPSMNQGDDFITPAFCAVIDFSVLFSK